MSPLMLLSTSSGVRGRHRGTDGLVGILCGSGALGLPCALVGADIGFTVGPCDIFLCGGNGFIRDAQAVGTHVGDQTHGAVACNVHAFVQGLGSAHGAGGRKAQAAGCLLLQGTGDKSRSGLLCPLALFSSATTYSAPSRPFSMARASASLLGSSFCRWHRWPAGR